MPRSPARGRTRRCVLSDTEISARRIFALVMAVTIAGQIGSARCARISDGIQPAQSSWYRQSASTSACRFSERMRWRVLASSRRPWRTPLQPPGHLGGAPHTPRSTMHCAARAPQHRRSRCCPRSIARHPLPTAAKARRCPAPPLRHRASGRCWPRLPDAGGDEWRTAGPRPARARPSQHSGVSTPSSRVPVASSCSLRACGSN